MAETKGFNLADVLASVPKMDTGEARIQRIDIDLLTDDKRNFYTLSGLDDLAANIATVGLQQPILVRPDPAAPDHYVIVSGHRRRAAIRMLVEDGHEELRQIPCLVERGQESEAMQELRLIFANSATRQLTGPELAAQADRVTELLYKLKVEEGIEFPGRMRDHVAQAVQTSKSRLARLRVIQKGLEEPLLSRWQKGQLEESAAYCLARMPMDLQWRLGGFKKLPKVHDLENIRRRAEKGATWRTNLRCPGGSVCSHDDGFLRCYGAAPYYGCDGTKCCLTCSFGAKADSLPCGYMCSKAKAARKEHKAKEADNAERAEQRRITAAQKTTVLYARRIVHAADVARLADDVTIAWRYATQHLPVGVIRKWAQGDFSEGWNSYMQNPELSPKELVAALPTSQTLQCSADYLLGLTDDLHPAAAPGAYITDHDPEEPTEAVGLFDLGDNLGLYRTFVIWDGKGWVFPFYASIDGPCVGWYPIPETPGESVEETPDDQEETPDDPEEEAPEEEAQEANVPEDINSCGVCSIGISPSGICRAAAKCTLFPAPDCCGECDEDCDMRCEWLTEEDKHE